MKNKINLFLVFCIALIAVRVIYTGTITMSFLLWNLLLAWIPYGLSSEILRNQYSVKWKVYLGLAISIAFLPNSIYLVTDLVHLRPRPGVPYWFDIPLLFSFSVLGLVYATKSLLNIEQVLAKLFPKWIQKIALLLIITASGYGVYVGRILRWNSWDILMNPLSLIKECIYILSHPMNYPAAYGYTVLFGIMQWMFWYMFRGNTGSKIKTT